MLLPAEEGHSSAAASEDGLYGCRMKSGSVARVERSGEGRALQARLEVERKRQSQKVSDSFLGTFLTTRLATASADSRLIYPSVLFTPSALFLRTPIPIAFTREGLRSTCAV